MKTSPYIKLTAVGLAGLLASCASSPEVTRIHVSASAEIDGSLTDRIHRDVNSYRASKGKSALKRHRGLDAIAQKHCDYLAKSTVSGISHHGFDGRALSARQAYKISVLGENVVSSTNHSPKHLVKLWSSSRTHDHTMRSDWTYTGIGTAVNPDGLLISTQVFGTAEDSSHMALTNRFNRAW